MPDDSLLARVGLPDAPEAPSASPTDPPRGRRGSRLVFGLVIAGCLVVAVAVTALGATRTRTRPATVPEPPVAAAAALPAMLAAPHLLVRGAGFGDAYGTVAVVPVADPAGPRVLTDLRCERVHVEAGVGVCLQEHPGIITTYSGLVFDATTPELTRGATFPLTGIPSRVKLSTDGRLAGVTVFVSGHSYAGGQFSTQTTIVDTASGQTLGDLESFELWRDGTRIQAEDLNLWGVSFAGTDGSFYATASTGGMVYLVSGDLATRRLDTIRDGLECPALSPDGTRIAIKRRLPMPADAPPGTPLTWRFVVLDLATLTETPLAETASVDDQLEWLDDERVLYGRYDDALQVTNVWVASAAGDGTPQLLVPEGESPTVVRP